MAKAKSNQNSNIKKQAKQAKQASEQAKQASEQVEDSELIGLDEFFELCDELDNSTRHKTSFIDELAKQDSKAYLRINENGTITAHYIWLASDTLLNALKSKDNTLAKRISDKQDELAKLDSYKASDTRLNLNKKFTPLLRKLNEQAQDSFSIVISE